MSSIFSLRIGWNRAMMTFKTIINCTATVLLLGVFGSVLQAQESPDITAVELREHVRYLASDSLEGRGTGFRGAELAAQYIAGQFKKIGLRPAGNDGTFFHGYDFLLHRELGARTLAAIRSAKKSRSLILQRDFRPLEFSATGAFEGPVVFAGYGITLPSRSYDDYAGIDVRDKAVLIFREHPEKANPHSEFEQAAGLRGKVIRARELGAKAVLIVGGLSTMEMDDLLPFAAVQSGSAAGVLVVTVTRRVADELLGDTGKSLNTLEDAIQTTLKPVSFECQGVTLSLETDLREIRGMSVNVAGLLPGSDNELKEEVVVVGAHYDHLGYGGPGSGSLKPDTRAIHNGADDNASGTAGLIELAEYLASMRASLKRSVLFLAFSGEERGLLGSAAYVEHPTIPLDRIVTMVNMDMIGRLRNGKLIVYGAGTSPGFAELLTRTTPRGIDMKPVPDGFGPSDQSSFYAKNIPVLHFFTDLHEDYHKPSDDWDKIEYEGMETVLGMVAAVTMELASSQERPAYASVAAPRRSGEGRGIRSYTGTIPDFGEQVEGMKISGVTDGSPAAVAGLQGGDIIVKFGAIEIKNLYDYTFALGEYKPGNVVDVVVNRGGEKKTFRLTVGSRK